MSQFNKPIDDAVKNTLNQHEFDFDPAAWQAMDKKLDDRKSGAESTTDTATKGRSRKGWIGFSFFVGLIVLALLAWFSFPGPSPILSENNNVEKSHSKSPDAQQDPNLVNTEKSNSENNLSQQSIIDIANEKAIETTKVKSPNTETLKSNTEKVFSKPLSSDKKMGTNPSLILPIEKAKQQNNSTSFSNTNKISFNTSSEATESLNQKNQKGASGKRIFSSKNIPTENDLPDEVQTNATKNQSGSILSFIDSGKATDQSNEPTLAAKITTGKTGTESKTGSSNSSTISLNTLLALSSLPIAEVSQEESAPKIAKAPYTFEKIKSRQAFPWYLGAQAGVYFSQTRNGKTDLSQDLFINRLSSKSYYLATHFGYQLRKNTAVEVGLSYSSIPYLFQYSYYLDPANNNNWDIESQYQKVHQLSIPARLQLKIREDLRLNFGGGVSLRSQNKNAISNYSPPVNGEELYGISNDTYQPILGFWETGLGYDRGPWTLDLKYQRFINSSISAFDFNGSQNEGRAQEWNFVFAFGRRFQKQEDPISSARSTLSRSALESTEQGLNWGIGIASGYELNTSSGTLDSKNNNSSANHSISEHSSPFKIGVWGAYAFSPDLRIHSEIWGQNYGLEYQLESGISTDPFNEFGTIKIRRLEIPVSLHYRFAKTFRLIGGLGFELNFVKPSTPFEYALNPDYAEIFNRIPISYKKNNLFSDLGIGYDWRQFSFEIRYRSIMGSNDLFTPAINQSQIYSGKNQIAVSLKYAFRTY